MTDAEDVGWDDLGVKFYIVLRAVPEIARVGQEVVYLVRLSRVKAQSFQ